MYVNLNTMQSVLFSGLLTHHQPVPMTQQEESGLTACIDAFEKKLIEDMLRQTEGQVSLTARLLQLPRKDFI